MHHGGAVIFEFNELTGDAHLVLTGIFCLVQSLVCHFKKVLPICFAAPFQGGNTSRKSALHTGILTLYEGISE